MRLTHRVVEGQVTRALRLVVQEARLQPVASVLGVVPVARAERWLLRGSLNAQATAQLDPRPHKRHNNEHLLKLQICTPHASFQRRAPARLSRATLSGRPRLHQPVADLLRAFGHYAF